LHPERVLIVGGGIGGMALAAALGKLGVGYVLLERAEQLGEVGSGLGILPGAVQGLEELGVDVGLFAAAAPFRRFRIATARGRALTEVDFERVFAEVGRKGYVVRRSSLHEALAALVDPASIRLGAEVSGVEQAPGRVTLTLRGESEPVTGDLLVGADGLNSIVRDHVLGDGPPRYAGETIFRGIATHELDRPELSRELFGRGRRAAYYELGPGRVYWWATAPLPAGTTIPPGDRRAYLAGAFAGWAFGIGELHRDTAEESILQNDIYDRRPVRRWHRDGAVLLGDAAHPTTPNLGQGACMAIEDAVVLARCIGRASGAEDAFRSFHAARAARTSRTVRLSRLWGDAGLWQRPLAVRARDAGLRAAPSQLMQRQALAQYRYLPGPLA
jgi:2-polyprenyl-6-methoxyphenol hydroxylase-like FAD-dependent oxidoreductase